MAARLRASEYSDGKIEMLLAATRKTGGIDQNGVSELAVPTRSMTLSPITMPEGEASEAWWNQLVQGDNSWRSLALTLSEALLTRILKAAAPKSRITAVEKIEIYGK